MWEKLSTPLRHPGSKPLAGENWLTESQQRCAAAGPDRELGTCRHTIGGRRLNIFLSQHTELITYAGRLFAETSRHLTERKHVFILTDANARVLKMGAHPTIIRTVFDETGVRPGVSLNEESCGTNAAALSLYHQEAMIVHGAQHFCRLFRDWSCIAAPFTNPAGETLGCVNLSTSCDIDPGEKPALVQTLARELQDLINSTRTEQLVAGVAVSGGALTRRQKTVLAMYADGLSYKQIAKALGLQSVKTVEEHLDAVRVKLGAANRRSCIRRALETGQICSLSRWVTD